MTFNWRDDSINILEILTIETRHEISNLLIEMKMKREKIPAEIAFLESALESKQVEIDRQKSHIESLEKELSPIRQKLAQTANQLARHQSVSAALVGGMTLNEFPDIGNSGLQLHSLEIEKRKLETDSEKLEKLISEAYAALRIEQREFETGNLHLRTLNDYQNRPLPDSKWLTDWIKANVSDESN
jgi:chromosome segregation ATPase